MQIQLQNNSACVVMDTLGAELRSFQDVFCNEYIFQRDERYWNRSSPVLFPIVGAVRGDCTVIDGKTYHLNKHGFARDMEFDVISKTENSVLFMLHDTAQTRSMYPYQFGLQLRYTLTDCTLTIDYQVDNRNDCQMPYYLGAHPAFICPLPGDDNFGNYVLRFAQEETVHAPRFDCAVQEFDPHDRRTLLQEQQQMLLDYALFDEDALLFDTLQSHTVTLMSRASGRGVEVSWENFPYLGVWTPAGKRAPFVCLEPWCGAGIFKDEGDAFDARRCVQRLEPFTSGHHRMVIRPI